MSETINGWTPPTIYDVMRDKTRIATQADIDRLQREISWLSFFYSSVKGHVDAAGRNLTGENAT